MTTLDAVRDLTERLNTFKTLSEALTQSKAFRTRATQLSSLSSSIRELKSTNMEIQTTGVEVPLVSSFFSEKLSARGHQILLDFTENRDSILAPEMNLEHSFIAHVKDGIVKWRQSLIAVWRDAVLTRLGELPEELINVLRAVPQFAASVRLLRDLQSQGLELASNLPSESTRNAIVVLNEVDSLASRKAELIRRLQGVPEDVVAFIATCAKGRAQLSLLSPTVHQWIIDNNLLESFHVTL